MLKKNNQTRNIGLIGHSGCGKTSLAETILYNSKTINRLGKVDDGTTVMDFEPEEIKRKITLNSSFYPFIWQDNKFNLIDTPGENDFLSDTKICLQAAEGVVVVISAVDGIKVGTEKTWDFTKNYGLPKIIFINKLDRERADFYKILEEIKNTFSLKPIPLFLPIGKEEEFTGLIDLIQQKSLIYKKDGSDSFIEKEIPENMIQEVKKWREKILENIIEADDKMMEKYLEGMEITPPEIIKTLIKGVKAGIITPVIPGSTTLNIGISRLLNLINQSIPFLTEKEEIKGIEINNKEIKLSTTVEAPFSALVFKTITDPFTGQINIFKIMSGTILSDSVVFNSKKKTQEKLGQLLQIKGKQQSPIKEAVVGDIVAVAKLKETKTGDTLCLKDNPIILKAAEPIAPSISFAVTAKENEDKVFSSLVKLSEEDPVLKIDRDQSTSEIIVFGAGQNHLEYIKDKLKRKFGVEIELKTPQIPYRETIKISKENVEYKHKKQSGGRGQFAVVFFDLFPLKRGEGYIFNEALTGTNVPRSFVPAVEKGVEEAKQEGVVAGYPVVDVKVRFFDGRSHDVDSSEMAFKIAAIMCFKKAMREANPVLLEPIMEMEITIPEDMVGDIMGDLNGRRGRVLGTNSRGKNQIIKAEAPLAEVQKYAFDLTSLTGGRGSFTMKQIRYEEIPPHLAEKIITAGKNKE